MSATVFGMSCVLESFTFPGHVPFPVMVLTGDDFFSCLGAAQARDDCWRACFRSRNKDATVVRNTTHVAAAYALPAGETMNNLSFDSLEVRHFCGFAQAATAYLDAEGNIQRLRQQERSIENVMTFPAHQHKGVANSLMHKLMKRLQQDGILILYLRCVENLIGFYEQFGFAVIKKNCN